MYNIFTGIRSVLRQNVGGAKQNGRLRIGTCKLEYNTTEQKVNVFNMASILLLTSANGRLLPWHHQQFGQVCEGDFIVCKNGPVFSEIISQCRINLIRVVRWGDGFGWDYKGFVSPRNKIKSKEKIPGLRPVKISSNYIAPKE